MWRVLITAAFLANGVLMTLNKAYEASGSSGSRFGYLGVYFGVGLAVSIALFAWKRPPLCAADMLLGGGIGLCSVLAGFFLLRAIADVGAVLTFPAISVGSLVAVALVSATAFRERMSWKGWLGVGCGVLALVLMN